MLKENYTLPCLFLFVKVLSLIFIDSMNNSIKYKELCREVLSDVELLKDFVKVKNKFISYSSLHELVNRNNKEEINIVNITNDINNFFIIMIN